MRTVGLHPYLVISALLFAIGLLGIFLNKRNIITLFMSIELLLLAVNLNFVAFSAHLKDMVGQIFSLLILTVAAAEAAIGLAILVSYYRQRQSIHVDTLATTQLNPIQAEGSAKL
jgi:NADH-quinone oxidoreductase subunit K